MSDNWWRLVAENAFHGRLSVYRHMRAYPHPFDLLLPYLDACYCLDNRATP